MESLTDREFNRAGIVRRTGVDPDLPFFRRILQGLRQEVPTALNAANAIPAARTAPPVASAKPIPAIRFQGQTFTGPNHVAAAETAAQRLNVPIDTIFEHSYLGGGDGFMVNGRYLTRQEAGGLHSENITKGRITGGPDHPEGTRGLLRTQPIRPAANPLGDFIHGQDRGGPMPSNTRAAYDTPYMRIRSNDPAYEQSYRADPFNEGTVSVRGFNDNVPPGELPYQALVDQQNPPRNRFSVIPGGRPDPNTTKGGNNPPITPEEVTNWLQQAEVPIRRTNTTEDGTTYIRMHPERERAPSPTVRIPADGHLGTIRDREVGNMFDTGDHWSHRPPPRDRDTSRMVSRNVSGGRYSEPQNLYDALRWRFSRSPDGQFLIPPDQAPVGVYRSNPPEPTPQSSPNQLDLFNEYLLKTLGRDNGPR